MIVLRFRPLLLAAVTTVVVGTSAFAQHTDTEQIAIPDARPGGTMGGGSPMAPVAAPAMIVPTASTPIVEAAIAAPSSGVITAVAPVNRLRSYQATMLRERAPMGQVIDSYSYFYSDDDYLRILSSPNRRAVMPPPFNQRLRAQSSGAKIPGVGTPSLVRLYTVDSSVASLVEWYSREYGFEFTVFTELYNQNGDTVVITMAKAVRPINNTIVSVMIWNPTETQSRRRKGGATSVMQARTSVEVQERAYRSRNDLVVEGPDAVVEFTWKVPYSKLIQKVSTKYQIDPYLLAALVQQESNFNASAMSVDSAMGLTQMIPSTAAMLGVSNPNDPHQSIDGGARYLKMMLKRFNGDPQLALAAYNAGPGNVLKYNGIPPFAETRDYVKRIMTRYKEKAAGRSAKTARVVKRS